MRETTTERSGFRRASCIFQVGLAAAIVFVFSSGSSFAAPQRFEVAGYFEVVCKVSVSKPRGNVIDAGKGICKITISPEDECVEQGADFRLSLVLPDRDWPAVRYLDAEGKYRDWSQGVWSCLGFTGRGDVDEGEHYKEFEGARVGGRFFSWRQILRGQNRGDHTNYSSGMISNKGYLTGHFVVNSNANKVSVSFKSDWE